MHFRVTGEWNGEPFDRVIEAENISDCYDHWMLWAQIAHADVTNIRIEELKGHHLSVRSHPYQSAKSPEYQAFRRFTVRHGSRQIVDSRTP